MPSVPAYSVEVPLIYALAPRATEQFSKLMARDPSKFTDNLAQLQHQDNLPRQ